jgi:hypothetical protein
MIIRRRRNTNFTIIGNEPANDPRLSAEALGVLTYLLTRPDDWTVYSKQLSDRFKCGRDKIRRILRELIDAGYITRRRLRNPETSAYVGIEYFVYDQNEPQTENPSVAKPRSEKPGLENPGLANTGDLLSTEPYQKRPTREGIGKERVYNHSNGDLS